MNARLQALLDHRSSVETKLRAEAAVHEAAQVEGKARLDILAGELKKCDRAADLRSRALREEYLQRAIASESRILQDAEAALDAARVRLREAARQRLALERLRERRWKAYLDARETAEEEELDESNLRYHSRAR